LEEIASCEVKYGVPVSNGKKIAQLICLGRKKYGTVITITQMCKKESYMHPGVHCGQNVAAMTNRRWKGESNENAHDNEEIPLWQKSMTKLKKVVGKERMTKACTRRVKHANQDQLLEERSFTNA
jgi:hypothetical protein